VTVPGNSPFILSVGATNEGGDQVADFSNYDQMLLKPDVVAPGYYQFEFETYDGTSQAAPYVSGAIALILQMHPDWTPAQVMSALATTATPVRERDPFAIFSQGSGRIDVPLAIQTDTLISPIHIALDTFIGVEKQVTLRIENKSNLEKTYSIHWQAKGGGILISFPEIVTIPAGESQELPLSISSAESQKSSEEIQLISGEMRWHIPIQIIPVSSR
jgi:minor extracellular serine protease Vpr